MGVLGGRLRGPPNSPYFSHRSGDSQRTGILKSQIFAIIEVIRILSISGAGGVRTV